MSISTRLKEFLDQNQVPYAVVTHPEAFTAQEIAAAAHVSGRELAKVVIVRIDGKPAMAVMPAPHQIDRELFRELTGAKQVELAKEGEFRGLFPDCEAGAMPPYGNLYGLPVYVARPLTHDAEIVFNAGSHREALRMRYEDFERLANPVVLDFTYGPPIQLRQTRQMKNVLQFTIDDFRLTIDAS